MSYIIKNANPFASTKLTEKGREKLAKGQLTFTSWAIGDSEINYDREVFVDDATLSGTSIILRPKDRQQDLKYFINTGAASPLVIFGDGDVRCIKAVINNEADERGHFSGDLLSGFTTLVEDNEGLSAYTRSSGTITSSEVNGGTTIDITSNNAEVGDFLLLKIGYSDFTNEEPQPHLWYKVQVSGATTLTVDRELPSISSGNIQYIIYKGGEIYDNEPDSISYWDTGTLSFDSACDITTKDVAIWNMNHVHSEDILGITGTTEYERHEKFGSYDYLGEKDNYLFNPATDFNKSVGIIHYTNKTISNLYGEYFFIDDDNKIVKLHLPDLMYNRRTFSGSTTGDKMGMTFVSNGAELFVDANGAKFINLIEDSDLVNGTPLVVGRVYPDLKIMVITDDEILAAMSYKGNRNWTLPKLLLTLTNPSGGVGTGTLEVDETIHVTYSVDNNSGTGIQPALPCQNYTEITNDSTSSKDVQFNIEDLDLLPFMRDDDTSGGFYADTFKVIYQKTTNGERPTTDNWLEIDYSTSVVTGSTITVELLETQNPLAVAPTFEIDAIRVSGATAYSIIDTLSMSPTLSPETLQFGDERFFYGNIETFIGATIYKTLFKVTINGSNFNKTTNVTRSTDPSTNPPTIRVSEVGIYDTDGDLVIISKLSTPIKLTSGNTVLIELSMDF